MVTSVARISPKVSDLFRRVLDILVLAVISDNRTRDRERIEFIHCAQIHNRTLHPDVIMTPSQLHVLFAERAEVLNKEIDEKGLKATQIAHLSDVIDRGMQRRVLSSIFAIAICDYELHDEERGFIRTALETWNSHLPDPTEVEATT